MHRHTDTQTHRHTDTDTDTQAHRQTHTDAETWCQESKPRAAAAPQQQPSDAARERETRVPGIEGGRARRGEKAAQSGQRANGALKWGFGMSTAKCGFKMGSAMGPLK
eukprot:238766-Rhodomonas_salina.1